MIPILVYVVLYSASRIFKWSKLCPRKWNAIKMAFANYLKTFQTHSCFHYLYCLKSILMRQIVQWIFLATSQIITYLKQTNLMPNYSAETHFGVNVVILLIMDQFAGSFFYRSKGITSFCENKGWNLANGFVVHQHKRQRVCDFQIGQRSLHILIF